MATTVGQHSVATFTSPVNGTTPIDANSVRGNDNTLRTSYVDHDADPGIHVQSSTLASRPVAGTAGRKWITEDSGSYTLWFDDGTNWNAVSENSTLAEVLASGNTTGSTDIVVSAGQKIRTPLVAAQDGTSAITLADSTGALTLHTALADTNLATIATAGKVSNSATTATSANTASAIVSRDASGNFTAGTVTAALSGNASTATALQTARTINGTSFDGTANITVTAAAGTLTGTTLASNVVTSSLTSVGTLANLTVTNPITGSVTGSSGSTTGNAATATALQTARTINGTSFDGTANITVTAAAGTLTGTTLNGTVVSSSLTSVGTIGTGVWQGTAISDTYLATISTAGKVSNSATTATSANTASAIVARDASGNFTAGTITATLSGAAPAGSLSGTTLASNVVSSSLTSVGTLANLTVTNPISGSVTGSSGSTTGNAATATALQTARNINGVSFNGTADITVTAAAGTLSGSTLASGVTASSLTSVGTLSSLTVSGGITANGQVVGGGSSGAQFLGTNVAYTGSRVFFATQGDSTQRLNVGHYDSSTLSFPTGQVPSQILAGVSNLEIAPRDIAGSAIIFRAGSGVSEQMRLTTTGLGIGKTATAKLDVLGTALIGASGAYVGVGSPKLTLYGATATETSLHLFQSGIGSSLIGFAASSSTLWLTNTYAGNAIGSGGVAIDQNNNVGLGVTPSAWGSSYKALDIGGGASIAGLSNNTYITTNAYDNGSNYIYKATAAATLYLSTAGQHRWYTAASGTAGNAITFTQAMTLFASGNLTIGGTNDSARLRIEGTTDLSTGFQLFRAGVTCANIWNNGSLVFGLDGSAGTTERARITSGGYTKHSNDGTYVDASGSYHEFRNTADAQALIVSATNASFGSQVVDIYASRNTTNGSFNAIRYYNTGAAVNRFVVADSGNVTNTNGSYGTISDAKHKTNIVDAGSQWADLKAVRFRKFEMVNDPSHTVMLGVVAQELELVSPGLIEEHTDRDADGNDLGTVTKSVKTSILLMKAAVALQEAMARIETLEARVAALGA